MDNNPFEAPRASTSSTPADPDRLYVRDGVVFAPVEAVLPELCAACGSDEVSITQQRAFSWTPLWARMTILLSPLIALLAMLVTRKTSYLTVSLCAADVQRVSRYKRLGWGALLGGTCLIVGSLFLVDVLRQGFLVALAAGVVLFFVAIWGFTKTMVVRAKYIDKVEARYKGIHPDVLTAIERGEG